MKFEHVSSKIGRVLLDAYNNTPYFNNIINDILGEDEEITADVFSRLPLFNKQTIRDLGWLNFVSGEYLDEDYRLLRRKNMRVERTSGTTGEPMQILWNQNDYFSSIMNHWKYRSDNFGITPASKYCTSMKNIPGGGAYYIDGNKMIFSIKNITYESIAEIIKGMNEFKPEWMYIQNSILFVLVYSARKLGLTFPDSLKYIEYMGEPICGYFRNEIAKEISVRTSNMYGCVETNGISLECVCGHNHLLPDNVYVEIVDIDGNVKNDGETGFVCVTGLHNTAMPILRYRLNDMACVSEGANCPCGNPNPIIEIKAARMPEFLILDDSNTYPRASMYSPIGIGMGLFEIEPNDIAFSLKMNSLDNYEIQVYQNPHPDTDIEQVFKELFIAYGLPNIKFSVEYTDVCNMMNRIGVLRLR